MNDMKAVFSPAVIAELRHRVITHNQSVGDKGALRLGKLKGLYKRFFNGSDPHTHALQKIDAHLEHLRGKLVKAIPPRHPFEAGRHPRGRGGQFRADGGGGGGSTGGGDGGSTGGGDGGDGGDGQRRFFHDVADPGTHRDLQRENAGYDAFQTHIIPETRYSLYGPPVAGAVGVGLGVLSGATASRRGTSGDRALTGALRWSGGRVGRLLAHGAATTTIRGARLGARQGIAAVNSALGTHVPRPSPTAGDTAILRAAAVGERAGRHAGAALGHGTQLIATGPAAATRWLTEHSMGGGAKARVAGVIAGGLVGGAWPGALLYSPKLQHLLTQIGPYIDASRPRRVRKRAPSTTLFDPTSPEVLEQQAALLALPPLAKTNITRLARELLRVGRRIVAHEHPSVASHTLGAEATGIGPAAARRTFGQGIAGFAVRRSPIAHLRVATGPVPPAAAGLAGVGAIAGAGAGYARQKWEASKHPRGAHGQFAHSGAVAGAKIGAVVGAGLGLTAGLIAARRGQTGLLRAAITRLQGEHAPMREAAAREAQLAHAQAYTDTHRSQLRDLVVPPGRAIGSEDIRAHLEQRAMRAWTAGEGAVLNAGPQAWHKFQVELQFDRAVRRQFGALKEPLYDITGARISLQRGGNFINTVDASPERMSPGQRRLWDDLTKRRRDTLDEIEGVYRARQTQASELSQQAGEQIDQRTHLRRELQEVPSWIEHAESQGTPLRAVREFARTRLGLTIAAGRSREQVFEDIHAHLPTWHTATQEQLNRLGPEINQTERFRDEARQQVGSDLSPQEIGAIADRFRDTAGGRHFLTPMPDYEGRRQEVAEAASKEFLRESHSHAASARETLDHLVAAQEAALQARLPGGSLTIRAMELRFPKLAGWMRQAAEDTEALRTSNYEQLNPFLKKVHDWTDQQKDPRQAWNTIKQISATSRRYAGVSGGFLLHNWKYIATLAGLGSAIGAVDITAPSGQRVRLNPKLWHRPEGLGMVHEWPNPIDRPNEALLGLTYRNRATGRRQFLAGMHVYSEEGDSHPIPFGADLEQVIGWVRQNRPGTGDGEERQQQRPPLNVADRQGLKNKIDELRRQGQIQQVIPPNGGRRYFERTGGDAGGHDKAVADLIYRDHVQYLAERRNLDGQSTNQPDRYWNSLRDLFLARGSEILTRAQRANLLVGGGGYRRGIFGSPVDAFPRESTNLNDAQKELVKQALIRQMNIRPPQANTDQYHLLWRAQSLLGQHYGLSTNQMDQVKRALDTAVSGGTSQSGQTQQGEPQPASSSRQSPAGSVNRANELFHSVVTDEPFRSDPTLHELFTSTYRTYVDLHRARAPDANDAELHRSAAQHMRTFYQNWLIQAPSIPGEKLGKLLQWDSDHLAPPRGAPIAGAARPPAIGGAAHLAAPKPARPPSGYTLHDATRPKQVLSQLGSYGLGQLGAEAAYHLVPGGAGVKFLAGAVGGLGASAAGLVGGKKLGHALGDRSQPHEQSFGESAARGAAGVGGQIGGTKLASKFIAPSVARSAIGAGTNRIAGAALQGAGQRIGGRLGGWLGTVGGEAADPAGGGIAGNLVGTAIGTGVGWLADEGVGLLYHHLSRYGTHVPEMAAKHLGVPPTLRQRHRTAAMVGTST